MTSILVLFATAGAIAVWWLWRQGLASKPWLEVGPVSENLAGGASAPSAAKVGLGVFLAVIASLFALFISAYSIRMQMPDWQALPVPRLLWLNTGMLVLSSVALQWTKGAAHRGDVDGMKLGLLAGGASALAFLSGQLLAWRDFAQAGYFLASNPANSFFYLITGLHGLHVLGGLAALGRTMGRVWRGESWSRIRLSVELCATYWHFLLFVWLVLFALLTGWASDFIAICRQLLT